MPTAVADDALTVLVCALEGVREDALRSTLPGLLSDRVLASSLGASELLRAGRGVDARGEGLRRVLADAPPASSELDRFLLESAALSSLRARHVFLGRELRHRHLRADRDRPFRVTSVGHGAHRELVGLLGRGDRMTVEGTVVDVDEDGARSAVERARQSGLEGTLRSVAADPRTLDGTLVPAAQDAVVVPVHLDFLPDEDVAGVLGRAADRLAPGGEVLTGHWHDDLTPRDRLVLEGFLGWAPAFRSPRSLARLVKGVARERGASVAGVLRGPNVFFVVQRPR